MKILYFCYSESADFLATLILEHLMWTNSLTWMHDIFLTFKHRGVLLSILMVLSGKWANTNLLERNCTVKNQLGYFCVISACIRKTVVYGTESSRIVLGRKVLHTAVDGNWCIYYMQTSNMCLEKSNFLKKNHKHHF